MASVASCPTLSSIQRLALTSLCPSTGGHCRVEGRRGRPGCRVYVPGRVPALWDSAAVLPDASDGLALCSQDPPLPYCVPD